MARGLPGTVSGMWQVGAGSQGDTPMSLAVGCPCLPRALTQIERCTHRVSTSGAGFPRGCHT